MKYNYYYNNVPGQGLCRNNLIYTSLISDDKKTFIQWYHNDTEYHKGQNQVIDPALMDQKWEREVKFLTLMSESHPECVPDILDIDTKEKKIYLSIEGVDFWQKSLDENCDFDQILPDWQEQILDILMKYKSLELYKYSLHPSSYFIINGKLKAINYFFCYSKKEGPISIADHSSHIYSSRQEIMRKQVEEMGLSWNNPQPLNKLQLLCFESFRNNYNNEFTKKCKELFDD